MKMGYTAIQFLQTIIIEAFSIYKQGSLSNFEYLKNLNKLLRKLKMKKSKLNRMLIL